MHNGTTKTKCMIYKSFLLFIPILILFSVQPEVFSKIQKESLGEIQGYAIRNTNTYKKAKTDNVVVMGAFASTEEPTTQPIPIKFKYITFENFYMGIAIINTADRDKDVTVTFELSGPRGGTEDADFTIPADSTYFAYIEDILGRPGFYTFKGGIKGVGSSKIKLLLTEE